MAYDDSFKPPQWWFDLLKEAMIQLEWDDPDLIRQARDIDGRGKPWGADRVSKMRTEKKATIQLVTAISEAAGIPSPIAELKTKEEAEAFKRWRDSYRRGKSPSEDPSSKRAVVSQALELAVKRKADQTAPVPSEDEGSPRDSRTRRPPRSR